MNRKTSSRARGADAWRIRAAVVACGLAAITGAVRAQEDGLLDRWEQTLRYGIDSEIGSTLDQIAQAGETSLDELIVERFASTRDDSLRSRIIEHFADLESPVLGEEVRALYLADQRVSNDLLQASANYLSRVVADPSPQLLERYAQIAQDADVLAASAAIDAIGRDGSPRAVDTLLDLYDRLGSADLRAAVIRALGQTGSEAAVPLLTGIASDEFTESSLRQYAAEALGRIGAPESVDLLTDLLATDDSLLRAYATYGLGFYDTEEVATLLEEALRDSFWRVRVSALEALGEQQRAEALPSIVYKARRDPERPVREEAIRTLARIGTPESVETLGKLALDDELAEVERIIAVEQLGGNSAGETAGVFAKIVEEQWESEGSKLLDAVGRVVSEHASRDYASLYDTLLEHPNYIIRVYAMRGIGEAGIRSRADALKRVARENSSGLVRRTALTALETMGVSFDPEAEDDRTDAEGGTDGAPADGASRDAVPADE